MSSLEKIWGRVEKPIIYLILGSFIALELVSIFFPSSPLDSVLGGDKIYLFVATILLFLFRFIDKRLPEEGLYAQEVTPFSSFDDAMVFCISKIRDIETIDMFSHSSQTYYTHLHKRLSGKELVQVVLRDPNSAEFLQHLKDQNARIREQKQIENAIDMWSNVKKHKGVQDLKVYSYDFEPSIYLLIINNSIGLLGFFEPCQSSWGYKVNRALVVQRKGVLGTFLMSYLRDWYSSMINEKCSKVL